CSSHLFFTLSNYVFNIYRKIPSSFCTSSTIINSWGWSRPLPKARWRKESAAEFSAQGRCFGSLPVFYPFFKFITQNINHFRFYSSYNGYFFIIHQYIFLFRMVSFFFLFFLLIYHVYFISLFILFFLQWLLSYHSPRHLPMPHGQRFLSFLNNHPRLVIRFEIHYARVAHFSEQKNRL